MYGKAVAGTGQENWRTSYGVIIPKEVLDRMKAGEDDTLIIRDMEKKEDEFDT